MGDLDVRMRLLVRGKEVLVAELGERADGQLDLPGLRSAVGVRAAARGQTDRCGKGDRAG